MTPDKAYAYADKWRRELETIRRGLAQAANHIDSLQPAFWRLNEAIDALNEWYRVESEKRP